MLTSYLFPSIRPCIRVGNSRCSVNELLLSVMACVIRLSLLALFKAPSLKLRLPPYFNFFFYHTTFSSVIFFHVPPPKSAMYKMYDYKIFFYCYVINDVQKTRFH